MRHIFAVLSLCIFLSTSTNAQNDVDDSPGRLRIATKASIAKDFVIASVDDVSGSLKTVEFGANGGIQYLVLDWLGLGAHYQALFELGSKVTYHDVDAFLQFIFPSSQLNDNSELFLTVPAGFSLMTDGSEVFSTGKGFNLGALFGGNYFFSEYVGATFEAGYIYRRIATKAGVKEIALNFHEIALNLGLVFRFL